MIDVPEERGKVYLVGAGPGDPELLTVKARRMIEEADTILYDALTGQHIVETFPPNVQAIDVGKRPAEGERTTQEEINRLLVEHAERGETVARLKGGDPTVYGRGGEEAEHLAAANVPFEIVPGVTSVVGAPGVAGIPLTHRDHASSFTVITGHEAAKEESALDWNALANTITSGGTLVILMGVRTLPRNVRVLRKANVDASTPVAMIERATWSDETVVSGTLETIVDEAERAGIAPPAITIIGDVVGVRDTVKDALTRDVAEDHPALVQTGLREEGEHVPIGVSHQ